jgi:acylphosphatase
VSTGRYLVSGRVQGVGFRWFVQVRANELGLLGFVRNLPDGQVEVVATGRQTRLQQLERHLWQGPTYSTVAAVEESDIVVEEGSFISFEII